MVERIQKVLDGELPREALNPAEAAELDAYEEAADAALATVRRESAPDLAPRVMNAVSALPAPGGPRARGGALRRALDWVWAPRPLQVRFRPAYALAAAGFALLLAVPLSDALRPTAPLPAHASQAPQQVFVHFRLNVPGAQTVQLAGDFTDWQPSHSLHEVAEGVWSVIVPVAAGVHQYSFVVDGERWVPDPAAPAVEDGFGGSNSRLDVIVPTETEAL